jgi:hypothetical protein
LRIYRLWLEHERRRSNGPLDIWLRDLQLLA